MSTSGQCRISSVFSRLTKFPKTQFSKKLKKKLNSKRLARRSFHACTVVKLLAPRHHFASSSHCLSVHIEFLIFWIGSLYSLIIHSLALHYANMVIKIQKSAKFPSLMVCWRHKLHKILPATVRDALRERLEPHNCKSSISSANDAGVSEEWNEAVAGILEWMAPLSHNMISWNPQSRHVFPVQTLYFANQHKTEATITELLVGLHYMWKFRCQVLSIPKKLHSSKNFWFAKGSGPRHPTESQIALMWM